MEYPRTLLRSIWLPVFAGFIAAALSGAEVPAQVGSAALPNFDIRASSALRADQRHDIAAARLLAARAIHFSELTGNVVLSAHGGLSQFTGIGKEDGGASGANLSGLLSAHWALSGADLQTVDVKSMPGKDLMQLQQSKENVPVFGAELKIALAPDGTVQALSGELFAGLSAWNVAPGPAEPGFLDAITFVLADVAGRPVPRSHFTLQEQPDNNMGRLFSLTEVAGIRQLTPGAVKRVIFPLGDGAFELAVKVELLLEGSIAYSYVVALGSTPRLLYRKNLVAHAEFSYRVYNTDDAQLRPEDGPAPGSPHPTGNPDGFQAPHIESRLIKLDTTLPGNPWLQENAVELKGNNCIVSGDVSPPDGFGAGDIAVRLSGPNAFDYRYEVDLPAEHGENIYASLVGLFFICNWVHDRWYQAGFDEISGNAQFDNRGRGGASRDPVIALGSSHRGMNNALMITPADGRPPFLVAAHFDGATRTRSGNFDAMLIIHELGHLLSARLIGDGTGLANPQGMALAEGWSDFLAVMMTAQAKDNFQGGVFSFGGWLDLRAGFQDNYYFGSRRYPYSVDMSRNPLTFRHIEADPASAARSQLFPGNEEEHNSGEVWAAMLWDAFAFLVEEHGHAQAEHRMLRYVINGMRLTPRNPTFASARDALLAAIRQQDPADLNAVWRAFARRGLGIGAVAPSEMSHSFVGVVESFDAPR